jgi:hypothetical protein
MHNEEIKKFGREIMRLLKTLAVLVSALSLLAVGCAQASSPTSRYVSLLIQDTGGYTTMEWAFSRTPAVLYSDGLLIVPNRIQTLEYPGQFVSSYQQKRDLASVPRFLSAAEKLHLTDPKFDWGTVGITDVTDTTFMTQISPKAPQTRISIYALGFDSDLTPKSTREARLAATKFRDKVESFSSDFMWTKSKPTVWKPTKWLYMASQATTDPSSKVYKWVGSSPLIETRTCAAMSATENAKLNALLPKLNSASRFSSNGKIWRVTVRPLLPHETGCQSIIN